MLGILVFPSRLLDDLGLAIVVAAALILLARPIAVAVVLLPWRTPVGQMVVVSWAGLRGAVPVVLATIPFTAGYPAEAVIFNVAFVVVVLSVALQAPTVGALARRLGVIAHERVTVRSEIVPVDAHDADIIEISIPIAAHMHPTTLSASPPPAGARITVIHRGDETIVADGNTTIEAGDMILVIAPRSSDLNEIERLSVLWRCSARARWGQSGLTFPNVGANTSSSLNPNPTPTCDDARHRRRPTGSCPGRQIAVDRYLTNVH